jgi:hypothetical protein
MTQNFVRYSPDVEQIEPDFDRNLQAVLDDMKQHMRGSLKTEGIGLVVPANALIKNRSSSWSLPASQ